MIGLIVKLIFFLVQGGGVSTVDATSMQSFACSQERLEVGLQGAIWCKQQNTKLFPLPQAQNQCLNLNVVPT